jgi:hypothetical protein
MLSLQSALPRLSLLNTYLVLVKVCEFLGGWNRRFQGISSPKETCPMIGRAFEHVRIEKSIHLLALTELHRHVNKLKTAAPDSCSINAQPTVR